MDPAARPAGPAVRPVGPAVRPVGTATRGTTGANRLRRLDRWLTGPQARRLRAAADPLVVDLGFGATPVTTWELAARLRAVRADVEVVGLEIDPVRVAAALAWPLPGEHAGPGAVSFERGGFELGPWAGGRRRPVLVRAANVLRQYAEDEVAPAWAQVVARLAPGGLLVDATCDELGRRAAWVAVAAGPSGTPQPLSLTLSVRLADLDRPGEVAPRLPKALIHRNVPGEAVHAWLVALDAAWARAAPHAGFGARQRWAAACAAVREQGWPVLDGPARWRLGEVSVDAAAVGLREGPGYQEP